MLLISCTLKKIELDAQMLVSGTKAANKPGMGSVLSGGTPGFWDAHTGALAITSITPGHTVAHPFHSSLMLMDFEMFSHPEMLSWV